ncbi:hypothetical protein [Nonomuraea sp. LPB2021202275-12-8]|uniref:hypothetical protein n=1 Tax=Nonomuraea sp. LPB2021202275-12-8 TaxID=3120159 RepID=UPI00300D8016
MISGERLRSADVRARTGTGAINLSFTAPPARLDARSGDGRVTVAVPEGAYARSATGDVRITAN